MPVPRRAHMVAFLVSDTSHQPNLNLKSSTPNPNPSPNSPPSPQPTLQPPTPNPPAPREGRRLVTQLGWLQREEQPAQLPPPAAPPSRLPRPGCARPSSVRRAGAALATHTRSLWLALVLALCYSPPRCPTRAAFSRQPWSAAARAASSPGAPPPPPAAASARPRR